MKDHIVYEHDGNQWNWWRESWEEEPGYPKGYYCTNGNGEGLFYVNLKNGDRNQLSGTCQFSLCGLKDNSARAKIRRMMNDND